MKHIKSLISTEYNIILREIEAENLLNINSNKFSLSELIKSGIATSLLSLEYMTLNESFDYCLQFQSIENITQYSNMRIGELVSVYNNSTYLDKGVIIESNFKSSFKVKIESYIDYNIYNQKQYYLKKYQSLDSLKLTANFLKNLLNNFPFNENNEKFSLFYKVFSFLRKDIDFIRKDYFNFNSLYTYSSIQSINNEQFQAIQNAILSKYFYLIQGPPGTGKTTTIIEMIFHMLKLNNRILVACSSNQAVDNILIKLNKVSHLHKVKIGDYLPIRIGSMIKMDEQVHNFKLNEIIKNIHNKEFGEYDLIRSSLFVAIRRNNRSQIKELIKKLMIIENKLNEYKEEIIVKSKLVFCTLSSTLENELLSKRKFDALIIDEASQSMISECIIPLQYVNKLILVGDQYQLPPVIQINIKTIDLYYNYFFDTNRSICDQYKTLFDLLISSKHKKQVSSLLCKQYRMNKYIMGFSNLRFYNEKLISDDLIANKTIIDIEDALRKVFIHNKQLFSNAVGYIDTSKYKLYDSSHHYTKSHYNYGEALIVNYILDQLSLDLNNFDYSRIGIITPYLAQRNYILSLLNENYKNIEVSTVDSFQGREKDIIFLSLVRSCIDKDGNENKLGFLRDFRRLNVSITRAKYLLIIIGDFELLKINDDFCDLIDYIKDCGLNMDDYLLPFKSQLEKKYNNHRQEYYSLKEKEFDVINKIQSIIKMKKKLK